MGDNRPERDRSTITGIDWADAFPFTHLFRTFRLAIHPSKLALALLGVLICFLGGWFLDIFAGKPVVVSDTPSAYSQPASEIQKYIDAPTTENFFQWRQKAVKKNHEELVGLLTRNLDKSEKADFTSDQDLEELLGKLEEKRATARDKAIERLDERVKQAGKLIKAEYDAKIKPQEKNAKAKKAKAPAIDEKLARTQYEEQLTELHNAASFLRIAFYKSSYAARLVLELQTSDAVNTVVRQNLNTKDVKATVEDRKQVAIDRATILKAVALSDSFERAKTLQGQGVFQAAISYGILMFNYAVKSVLSAELFFNENFTGFSSAKPATPGLVGTLVLSARGMQWFMRVHWLYFIIYSIFCLAVWSIAGGAICRIAALHATRDEKIPLSEAVAFAWKKIAAFFFSPIMPVLFVIACCVPLLIIGLIGAIPAVGELIVGLSFGLVLAISFILALIIVGGLAGLGLMYPTIAVEGSDAFDAFSRCYGYIYARPWRTVFYTLVTAIYGTLCFTFVKLFAGLIFSVSSVAVGAMMNMDTAKLAAPLGKFQAIWFSPSLTGPFFGRFDVLPLSGWEYCGSRLVALWVYVLVGLVIAFAISFFFSGYSMIYLLLRKRVDATEMDEVFVEEFETADAAALPETEPTEKPAKATEMLTTPLTVAPVEETDVGSVDEPSSDDASISQSDATPDQPSTDQPQNDTDDTPRQD